MGLLKIILVCKILITLGAWALPLLFAPKRIGGAKDEASVLSARLLGWAYLSLTLMYGFGLAELLRGQVPWAVIAVGLVSNGGAALLLSVALLKGQVPKERKLLVQLSAAAVWLITLGLIVAVVKLRTLA